MATVKLSSIIGSITGLNNKLFGGGLPSHPKQMAVDLLKSNPLEISPSQSPTAHLVKNPLEFATLQYPKDLGLQSGAGHYILFYSISNTKSLGIDKKFNDRIGVSTSIDIDSNSGDGLIRQSRIKKLKTRAGGEELQLGRSAPNSIIAGGLETHTQVTGGVALYMPPGIKVTYGVETGHSEMELAGLAAQTLSRAMTADNSKDAIKAALDGVSGVARDAARRLAIEVAESLGMGGVKSAITKVTAEAMNNFSEATFERVNPRQFNYTFNLIARNKEEVKDIQNIIKFFKFHMHPELDKNSGNRYFRVPSEFEIHYAYNDQVNNYMHQISRCVCQTVDVDYGSGPSFRQFDNEGAAPVNITLTVGFIETTVMTKEEIAAGY